MLHRSPKNQKKTVSERVTDIILHPNENQDSDNDSAEDEKAPKVVDFDEYDCELPDPRSSHIRKRNVKLLSEQSAKYRGKIASRKDLENESDDNDSEEDGSSIDLSDNNENGQSMQEFNKGIRHMAKADAVASDQSYGGSDSDSADDDNNAEEHSTDESESTDGDEVDIKEQSDMLTETNRQAEIQKGVCVQNQLNIWEKLLELRIHSQKLLNKVNLLPEPLDLKIEQQENKEMASVSQESKHSISNLLKLLLDVQCSLYGQNSEIKNSLKAKKRQSPFADAKSGAPPTKRIGSYLENNFVEFKPYRNAVLLKWDDRTKLLTPGAGSKKKSVNEEYDIIRKIDNTLLNRSALIEKSQLLRANAQTVETNAEEDDEVDVNTDNQRSKPNIYDDTDFYHQQLRELIEYKANLSTSAGEVTKQLIALQKLRQKMKKKVDTRASKGRKIRYVEHKKLINFMAPNDVSSWTEDSKNELCKSLFAS